MEPVFTINSWALTAIVLFVTLYTGQANAVEYKKVGDEVVLSPGSVTSPITSITWKHNSNLAAEWYGGVVEFYRDFKGRCELNTTTGELTIPNLTLNDSGSYTAEINNRVLDTTEVKVISGVSKPTVSENCDAEKTHCVLTCEGITTDSEPVTYTWWSGDVMKSQTNQLIITKNDTEPSFTCKLENPVSSERSREVTNPFTSSSSSPPPPSSPTPIPDNDNSNLNWLILVLFLFLAAVGVVIAVVIYKRRTGRYPPPLSLLPRFKNNVAANTSQVSCLSVAETQTLLHDNKDGVQALTTLDHINETESESYSSGYHSMRYYTDKHGRTQNSAWYMGTKAVTTEVDKTVANSDTKSKTPENQETAAEQQSGSSSGTSDNSGGNGESNQTQKNDDSTEGNNDSGIKLKKQRVQASSSSPRKVNKIDKQGRTENSDWYMGTKADNKSETPENQETAAEQQQSGSSSGTSDHPGENGESNQTQKNYDSTGTNKDPESESYSSGYHSMYYYTDTKSKTPENQETAADQQQFGSSSGTNDHPAENPSEESGDTESTPNPQSAASPPTTSDQPGDKELNANQNNVVSTENNKDPANTSQVSCLSVAVIKLNNVGVQASSSSQRNFYKIVDPSKESEGKEPPAKPPQSDSPSGPSDQPEKPPEKPADQAASTIPQPSSPPSEKQEINEQDQNNEESKGSNKDPETQTLLHDNNDGVQVLTTLDHINETVDASKESEDDRTPPHPETSDPPAKPPRPENSPEKSGVTQSCASPPNTNDQPGGNQESLKNQTPVVSPGLNDKPAENSPQESGDTESTPNPPSAASPPTTNDQPEGDKELNTNQNNEKSRGTEPESSSQTPRDKGANTGKQGTNQQDQNSDGSMGTKAEKPPEKPADQVASTDPQPSSPRSGFFDYLKAAFSF